LFGLPLELVGKAFRPVELGGGRPGRSTASGRRGSRAAIPCGAGAIPAGGTAASAPVASPAAIGVEKRLVFLK
jgi:hypothetical protein